MSRMRAACRRKTRSLFENKESQKICGFSGFQFSRKVTERAHPAPLRGAAAAAAEGPINRRSEKNAFSEAASIFPLRLLLWNYQGRVALSLQRRRPPPAADAGRSCWGSGLQDASAAQGTKQTQGAATRRLQRVEIAGTFLVLFWCQKRTIPARLQRVEIAATLPR